MRITHILRRFVPSEWGGIESYVLGVSQALTRHNISVSILTTSALSENGRFEFSGVTGRRFPYFYPCLPISTALRNSMDRKGGNPFSFSIFIEILKLPRGSIVHVHTMGRLAALARLACFLKNIPFVVSLHAGYFCIPDKETSYFREMASKCFDWGRPFNLILGVRKILQDADAVACFGLNEYHSAKKKLVKPLVVYLPHGIDLQTRKDGDGPAFRKKHQLGNGPLLLCVGRIDSQKNQLALIQALPGIRRECPETKLILIGPISVQTYYVEIQANIRNLQLTEDICIIPGLPPSSQELADAYAACDVFVLPSIHEPFGIVVLEAWSYAKPVVISPLPSLQGVVLDGVNGRWCEGTDPSQLCETISSLLRDPQTREKIGEAGLKTLQEHYTHEKHMDQLCELYRSVLSKRN